MMHQTRLVGLGKYALVEAKIKQTSCLRDRAKFCEERLRMQLQKPQNFRTDVNGLGRVYSQAPGTNAITPSNKIVFREYNKFINACIGRGRVLDATDEVQTKEVVLAIRGVNTLSPFALMHSSKHSNNTFSKVSARNPIRYPRTTTLCPCTP